MFVDDLSPYKDPYWMLRPLFDVGLPALEVLELTPVHALKDLLPRFRPVLERMTDVVLARDRSLGRTRFHSPRSPLATVAHRRARWIPRLRGRTAS